MADLNLDTVTDTARDAFYVTVGAGVIAFQKLQVQRVELTKTLTAQLDEAKGNATAPSPPRRPSSTPPPTWSRTASSSSRPASAPSRAASRPSSTSSRASCPSRPRTSSSRPVTSWPAPPDPPIRAPASRSEPIPLATRDPHRGPWCVPSH